MNAVFCNVANVSIRSCLEHSHKDWEIILNLTGSNISVINHTQYKISVGDVMIIPPNVPHSACSSEGYTDMYIQAKSLDFSGITIVHDYDNSILALMKLLNKVTTEKENNYMMISDSLLDTICQYVKKYSEKMYRFEFVNSLKNEIYKNLDNSDFNIPDVVKALGYNINYVRRCFKDDLGQTPLEYLTHLRISMAKSLLLQETFLSVEDVSQKCGFKDSFYFSKVFKTNAGISPQKYRKVNVQ